MLKQIFSQKPKITINQKINSNTINAIKVLQMSSNEVDNLDLIAVNSTIQGHPIEAIGKTLRASMTSMKTIDQEEEKEAVVFH